MDAASFRFAQTRRDAPVVTLRFGRREIAFRPVGAVFGLGLVGLLAATGLLATAALISDGGVVAAMLRHQGAVEAAYEDRIIALRLQIDRLTTRQVLEQDSLAAKVEALSRQHSALSDTGARLADLMRKAQATGLAPGGADATAVLPPAKPGRQAALDSAETPLAAKVGAIARDSDGVTRQHVTLALRLAEGAASSVDLIQSTMAKLGVAERLPSGKIAVAPSLAGKPAAKPGLGGPFIAADTSPDAAIGRASALLDRLDTLRRRLVTLPLRRPLAGDLTVTSGFGARPDPFIGAPAMHTGIDFRAATGTPVLATAPGTVEATGPQGGYGLAVDLDHGGGLATRYGHLSRIAVAIGQTVQPGDVIGYAGSTGRSTGPHLHYETRVDGEAVDPSDWLAAGERLTAFLD